MELKASQVILPAEMLNSFQDLSKLKLIQSEIIMDSETITPKVFVSSYKLQLSDLRSLEISNNNNYLFTRGTQDPLGFQNIIRRCKKLYSGTARTRQDQAKQFKQRCLERLWR